MQANQTALDKWLVTVRACHTLCLRLPSIATLRIVEQSIRDPARCFQAAPRVQTASTQECEWDRRMVRMLLVERPEFPESALNLL